MYFYIDDTLLIHRSQKGTETCDVCGEVLKPIEYTDKPTLFNVYPEEPIQTIIHLDKCECVYCSGKHLDTTRGGYTYLWKNKNYSTYVRYVSEDFIKYVLLHVDHKLDKSSNNTPSTVPVALPEVKSSTIVAPTSDEEPDVNDLPPYNTLDVPIEHLKQYIFHIKDDTLKAGKNNNSWISTIAVPMSHSLQGNSLLCSCGSELQLFNYRASGYDGYCCILPEQVKLSTEIRPVTKDAPAKYYAHGGLCECECCVRDKLSHTYYSENSTTECCMQVKQLHHENCACTGCLGFAEQICLCIKTDGSKHSCTKVVNTCKYEVTKNYMKHVLEHINCGVNIFKPLDYYYTSNRMLFGKHGNCANWYSRHMKVKHDYSNDSRIKKYVSIRKYISILRVKQNEDSCKCGKNITVPSSYESVRNDPNVYAILHTNCSCKLCIYNFDPAVGCGHDKSQLNNPYIRMMAPTIHYLDCQCPGCLDTNLKYTCLTLTELNKYEDLAGAPRTLDKATQEVVRSTSKYYAH